MSERRRHPITLINPITVWLTVIIYTILCHLSS